MNYERNQTRNTPTSRRPSSDAVDRYALYQTDESNNNVSTLDSMYENRERKNFNFLNYLFLSILKNLNNKECNYKKQDRSENRLICDIIRCYRQLVKKFKK